MYRFTYGLIITIPVRVHVGRYRYVYLCMLYVLYVCIHIRICTDAWRCLYTYAYTRMCICMYTYTCRHAYIHTYIPTYIRHVFQLMSEQVVHSSTASCQNAMSTLLRSSTMMSKASAHSVFSHQMSACTPWGLNPGPPF